MVYPLPLLSIYHPLLADLLVSYVSQVMASFLSDSQVPSLADLTNKALLKSLRDELENETRDSTFACGGSIPFAMEFMNDPYDTLDDKTATGLEQRLITDKPVTIRFGIPQEGETLVFPPKKEADNDNEGDEYKEHVRSINELIDTCEPATFGRAGTDVYDEGYRRAYKLDTDQFCTNFCPYNAGIMAVVAQLLLPGVLTSNDYILSESRNTRHGTYHIPSEPLSKERSDATQTAQHRDLRAQLYELNVFSGPGSMFKAHVDTPRNTSQIGSLVVALPNEFEGPYPIR